MKLQVQIINANKAAANSTTLDVAVGPTDTVSNLQEQVASTTKMSAFPDQKLVFKGQTLSSNQSLSDCGVKEGDTLELVVQASEKTLIKQLSDLLGKKAMSPEELGLLYSYKYSISFEDVVNALGSSSCKLRSFLESQKCFSFQGDCVKVVDATEKARQQPPVVLAPIQEDKVHRFIEVSVSVELHTPQGKSHPTFTHDMEEDEDNYMRLQASETVQGRRHDRGRGGHGLSSGVGTQHWQGQKRRAVRRLFFSVALTPSLYTRTPTRRLGTHAVCWCPAVWGASWT